MEIRRSRPDDATRISELEGEIFSDPWQKKDIFSYICSEDGMCFTALDGDVPIAYVIGRLIAPEGEIYRIAVDEKYRGRGIGYRLLSYALKSERGRGLETVFLEVRSKNAAAIALYSSYGFRKMGVRRGYYKNPDDDAIVMIYGKLGE
ncbi:MAG: ribosomal protein S18-alanine N-acetyltransferase [Clostridia bacterium]|nr:ribosomal protein S18-alanine N-acetyltransferase [Clostridia bacterium]